MRGRQALIKVPPRTMKLAEKNYDRERKLAEAVVADRAFALSQVAHGCLQSTIFDAEGFDISVLAPASAPKGAQRHQATPADIERPAAIGRPLRPAVALEGATVHPSQTVHRTMCSPVTPLPPILRRPIRCSSRQGFTTMAPAPALLTPKPAYAPASAPASKQLEAHWAQDPQDENGKEAAAAHRPSYGFISHQEWSPPQPFVSYASTGANVTPAPVQHLGVQLSREPRDRDCRVTAASARQEAQRIVALHEAREAIARERAEVRAVMPRVESRGVLVPRLPLSTLLERLVKVEAAEAAHVESTAIAAEQARQVAAMVAARARAAEAKRQASRQAQLQADEAQEAERARAVQLAREATVKATDAALLGLLAYKATVEAKAEAERAARDAQVAAAKERAEPEAHAAHHHAHQKAAQDLESRFEARRRVERNLRGEVSGESEEAIRVTAEEGERMGRMVVAQQMLAEYRAGACFADRRLLHDS